MHCVVCVKQVPDTSEVRVDPRTNALIREGVPSIVNPDDLHALELAVRIREVHGGRVTALSMGPLQAEQALQRCLAQGADAAVLLTDRAFAAADTFATTHVLALAVRRLAAETPVDLVLCGRQAIDGETGQVGPGLAARLGLPLVAYVAGLRHLDPDRRELVVERELGPWREVVRTRLPAVLTVAPAAAAVRYAALPDLLRASSAPVVRWSAADLGADPGDVGLAGSPTRVTRSFPPPRRGPARVVDARTDPVAAARQLAAELARLDLLAGEPEEVGADAAR